MAKEYIIPMNSVTVANASPVTCIFFQCMVTPPFAAIEVVRAVISQRGSTTPEMIGAQLGTQLTSFPTLTAQAPIAMKAGDPVSKLTGGTAGAAGTSGVNASAEGAGAKTVVVPDSWNNQNGFLWAHTPRETFIETAQSPVHGFFLAIPTAPSARTLFSAYLVIAELG